jgi:hypothetical protein
MLYAELVLKRKVDWRMVLIRNLEDRTEYAELDIPDNFGIPPANIEEGAALVVHAGNLGTSSGTGTEHDKDSIGRVIPVRDMGTRLKEVEATGASITLGIGLPRLELDIQKTTSASGPDVNVAQLQRDITTFGTKYKLLQ